MGALRRRLPVEPQKPALPIAEDAAVGRDEPVAVVRGGRGQPDDGRVEPHSGRISVRGEVAVGEEPTECRHDPVAGAVTVRIRRHADDLAVRRRRSAGRHRRRRGPTGFVLLRRRVVDRDRGRARRVHLPRWHARHDAADDASQAVDVLVALAVAELEAAGEVGVAAVRPTAAVRAVAPGIAESEAVAAAIGARAGGVAVHVVARAAAERGVVRHPPTTHDGVGGAVVVPGDRATEL